MPSGYGQRQRLKTVAKHLALGKPIRSAAGTWYVLSDGSVRAIIKVSNGIVT